MSETLEKERTSQVAANSDGSVESSGFRAPADVLDRLLDPQIQESLTVLIDNLPKLTESMLFLTKAYDFTQAVVTDRVLLEDMTGGLREFIVPVREKVKDYAAAAIEASDRASNEKSVIGVFGLLGLLRDPEVQKILHFAQAFLSILGEKNKK